MSNISACTVVHNPIQGKACFFENLVNLTTLLDEILVIDLGSDDGTYETLLEIAETNLKFTIISNDTPESSQEYEAAMNKAISSCRYERVLYFFQNEVFPLELVARLRKLFNYGYVNMIFWTMIYKTNFQDIKRYPVKVRRTGWRKHLTTTSPIDGDVELCSDRLEWGTDWTDNEVLKYADDIILQIKPDTAFINQGFMKDYNSKVSDPGWLIKTTRFNIPKILKHHLGETKYKLSPDVVRSLKLNDVFYLSQEGVNV